MPCPPCLSSPPAGRDLAAYLAHRRTTATLQELAKTFGLTHTDDIGNLIRRAEQALIDSSQQGKIVETILEIAVKTENRVRMAHDIGTSVTRMAQKVPNGVY